MVEVCQTVAFRLLRLPHIDFEGASVIGCPVSATDMVYADKIILNRSAITVKNIFKCIS